MVQITANLQIMFWVELIEVRAPCSNRLVVRSGGTSPLVVS